MAQLFELITHLLGSYSGAFVLFWGLMLLACVGLWALKSHKNVVARKGEGALFWVFGMAMAAFSAFRPIGIAPDDLAYLDIYNRVVCPTLTCGQWVQGGRDWGWYSLVGLLKSFGLSSRVMLLITAFAVLIKLWVIFRLSRRPMVALLFFTAVFYEVQDLTAFRVSLSLAVFMVAIYSLVCHHKSIGVLATFTPGLFHKQALLSPLILLAGVLHRWYATFVVLCLLPIALLFMGLSFHAYKEISIYQSMPWLQLAIQGMENYIAIGQSGVYDKVRIMPYSYLPLIALMVCFAKDVVASNMDLYRYCGMSFVIACWLTWFFASWQEPQARFFEFFALPSVLLVGNFRNRVLQNTGVILVSAVFVVRYNVLHPLLTGFLS